MGSWWYGHLCWFYHFLHFDLSETIAFARYLPISWALQVTSESCPLPIEYSNLHDCLLYKRTGCFSGSWTADTYLVTNPHGGRGQHQGGSYHDGPHISRPGLSCNYVTLGSCEVMFRNKSLASLCSLYLMCASSRQQPPGRSRSCGGRGRRWSGKQINANIYQTCLNLEKSF